jgi:hypothetical protein
MMNGELSRWEDDVLTIQWIAPAEAQIRLGQLGPAILNGQISVIRNGRVWDGDPPNWNDMFKILVNGWSGPPKQKPTHSPRPPPGSKPRGNRKILIARIGYMPVFKAEPGLPIHVITTKISEGDRLENASAWLLSTRGSDLIRDSAELIEGGVYYLKSTIRIGKEEKTRCINVRDDEDTSQLHHRIRRNLLMISHGLKNGMPPSLRMNLQLRIDVPLLKSRICLFVMQNVMGLRVSTFSGVISGR